MSTQGSMLHFFSIAVVTETKAKGSDHIAAMPIEALPRLKGEVGKIKKELKVTGSDVNGNEVKSAIIAGGAIPAEWIPLGQSNRMTAPDVVKGEMVLLIRYSDTDTYYWTPMKRQSALRRLETVLYAFSNLASGVKAFTKATSYWFEVSTHEKYIHLHTSANDGEVCEYDVSIDCKQGVVTITDSLGTMFRLDSQNGKVGMKGLQLAVIEAETTVVTNNLKVGGSIESVGSITSGGTIAAGGEVTSGGQVKGTAFIPSAVSVSVSKPNDVVE